MEAFALMEFIWELLSDNDSDQLKVVVNSLLSDAVKVNDPLESGIFSRMFMSDPHVPDQRGAPTKLTQLWNGAWTTSLGECLSVKRLKTR